MLKAHRQGTQCDGKVAHTSKQEAIDHRWGLVRQGYGSFTVYRCPHCGRWHVGHGSARGSWRSRKGRY